MLSGPAVERIASSRLEELVVTNTIPLREDAQQVAKIKVLSIAGLLGRGDREHSHGDQRQYAVQLARFSVVALLNVDDSASRKGSDEPG